jgi:pimeloyl-ACP methyl ester carboxylesterase
MSISTELGRQKEVRLTGGTVRYRERGEGDPIVFVHGALVNGDLWAEVAPALANNHRCITPDWPFGAHDAPMDEDADLTPPGVARLIADFLAELDLRDVTLVANDTGGAFAQIVVTEHPERIGRLVLTSCDAFRNFPPHSLKPSQLLGFVPGVGGVVLAASVGPRPAQKALGKLLAKQPAEDATLDSFFGPIKRDKRIRRDFIRFFRALRPKHTLRAAEKLPKFDRPALVAWSADDLFFPKRHGRRLAELMPQARFELIEDSRTFSPVDQPQRLAGLIGEFVGKSGPPASTP